MKKLLLFWLFGAILSFAARAEEPEAQITFRVSDDFGNAVTGAPVVMTTAVGWRPGGPDEGHTELREARGLTDTNGVAVLKLRCKTGNIRNYSVLAEDMYFDNNNKMKIGETAYYRDLGGRFRFTNVVDGQWQPWNPTVDIELKAVLNPIAMYARSYGADWDCDKVPEYGKAIGFDLMKGDWIAPYGKGEIADFIFRLDCELGGQTSDKYQIFDAMLTLTFSNDGDGIQPVDAHPLKGSALRLARFAPETGYATNWVKTTFQHEGEALHERREDRNYFFRVRTKRDEAGRVVSALYGKVHGEIDYSWSRVISLAYYLNPTPNDRNMEFDPSKNLFRDLPAAEQVKDP